MPMSKVVLARYDAQEQVLRLAEPLEGVADEAEVSVTLTPATGYSQEELARRPWLALRGTLSPEAADELQQIIDDEFPPFTE
jgi:hypothetical protein